MMQTTKMKRNKTVFGVRYQFIKVKLENIACVEQMGYGIHSYRLTDKEKPLWIVLIYPIWW